MSARHWTEHHSEAERLLEAARTIVKRADERKAERQAEALASDASDKHYREIRDDWFDAHIAASDLVSFANLHARLADLGRAIDLKEQTDD